MSRTDSRAPPRSPISRAAVTIRYRRRSWSSLSRRTCGLLGDIAAECNQRGRGREHGGVTEQDEPAAPLRQQAAGRRYVRLVEGLAGGERQPPQRRCGEQQRRAADGGDLAELAANRGD